MSTALAFGCPNRNEASDLRGRARSDPKPETHVELPQNSASIDTPDVAVVSTSADAARSLGTSADLTTRRDGGFAGGPWQNCYANYRPTTNPMRDVTRLGLLCGPANGMRQSGSVSAGEVDDKSVEQGIDLKAGDCLRAFAVVDAKVDDFDLEVLDPSGEPLASDRARDRWSVVDREGAICVASAGKYSVRLRPRKGKGAYALTVWRLP
jgi:hypothetical protein